jgi:alkylated DNA repair dioxygenase AlkB
MRTPLVAGAWVEYDPAWIRLAEAAALLSGLLDELRWEQREIVVYGRRIMQPRLIAWAGELAYRYSGLVLEPRPFTPLAARLLTEVRARARVPFNHVLANRYRHGDDSMGFHADAEPELGRDPVVASVSFGVARRLVLKPRRAARGARHTFDLGAGSLFIMGGTCQRQYVHGVPRQPHVEGERISLTFRWLHRGPSPSDSGDGIRPQEPMAVAGDSTDRSHSARATAQFKLTL